MDDNFKSHMIDRNVWKRLLFMLLFGAIYTVVRLVLVAVVVFQLLWVLFTGSKNDKLLAFGSQLATFVYQIYRYLTFNTEKRPFPFDDFPSSNTRLDDSVEEVEIQEHSAEKDEVLDDPVDAASETAVEAEDKNTH